MNTTAHFLTDSRTPYELKLRAKNKAYQNKQKARLFSNLKPQESLHLKSALSQTSCGTSYVIECVDTIFEIQHLDKHFPLLKDFQNEMIKLNSELYKIGVVTEDDEVNRIQFEKMIDSILKPLPKFNLKQLELLSEFVRNLEFKR